MREKVTFGKIWGIIYPPILYVLISLMVSIIGEIITVVQLYQDETFLSLSTTAQNQEITNLFYSEALKITLIAALISIPIMLILMYRDKKHDKAIGFDYELSKISPALYLLVVPFAISTLLFCTYISSLVMACLPDTFANSYEGAAKALYSGSIWFQILTIVIAGPVVEELLYRGVVFGRIKRISSFKVAAIISALIFGLSHGNWVQGIYALLLGLCLAFVYEKYRNIIAPIILHMTANGVSLAITTLTSSVEEATDVSSVSGVTSSDIIIMLVSFALSIVFGILINRNVKREVIIHNVPGEQDEYKNDNIANTTINAETGVNSGDSILGDDVNDYDFGNR